MRCFCRGVNHSAKTYCLYASLVADVCERKNPHLSFTVNPFLMRQQIKVRKGEAPEAFRGSGPSADFRPLFSAGRAPPCPVIECGLTYFQ